MQQLPALPRGLLGPLPVLQQPDHGALAGEHLRLFEIPLRARLRLRPRKPQEAADGLRIGEGFDGPVEERDLDARRGKCGDLARPEPDVADVFSNFNPFSPVFSIF